MAGLSSHFSLVAAHKLDQGAVIKDVAAIHTSISSDFSSSVSTQINALRRLLRKPHDSNRGKRFQEVLEVNCVHSLEAYFLMEPQGRLTLVCTVDALDIMATLLQLKHETELENGGKIMKWTFSGGSEAHLLAEELAAANVGVIVQPRPFPYGWEQRRL